MKHGRVGLSACFTSWLFHITSNNLIMVSSDLNRFLSELKTSFVIFIGGTYQLWKQCTLQSCDLIEMFVTFLAGKLAVFSSSSWWFNMFLFLKHLDCLVLEAHRIWQVPIYVVSCLMHESRDVIWDLNLSCCSWFHRTKKPMSDSGTALKSASVTCTAGLLQSLWSYKPWYLILLDFRNLSVTRETIRNDKPLATHGAGLLKLDSTSGDRTRFHQQVNRKSFLCIPLTSYVFFPTHDNWQPTPFQCGYYRYPETSHFPNFPTSMFRLALMSAINRSKWLSTSVATVEMWASRDLSPAAWQRPVWSPECGQCTTGPTGTWRYSPNAWMISAYKYWWLCPRFPSYETRSYLKPPPWDRVRRKQHVTAREQQLDLASSLGTSQEKLHVKNEKNVLKSNKDFTACIHIQE